jgi:basic amino acid/polyamine antiporter, APA family
LNNDPPREIGVRRILNLLPASSVVVANMIGTGIFTTTGLMVALGAGTGDVLLAWLVGGVIAFCGALCYGEIGANLPLSGAEYSYLSRLIHPVVGFLSGWTSMIVGFAAPIAASAMAMHLYLARIAPGWPVRIGAVATIVIFALLHAYDLRIGSTFQTLLVAIQLALLILFIALTLLSSASGAPPAPQVLQFNPQLWVSPAFAVVLIFVSFSYSGWNAAAYIGAEIRSPERNLPRALLIGTGVVTLLYVLVNLSYVETVPLAELSGVKEVAHVAGEKILGSAAAKIISGLIAMTLISPISAMILIGPRVLEAMASDRLMPSILARLNHRNVPANAVWLQSALAVLFVLTSSFERLLIYIGFTLSIFTGLAALSLFRLRRAGQAAHRTCVGYPATPVLFACFAGWMIAWSVRSEPMAAAAGLGTLATGLATYAVMRRFRS